ncbi:MAG: acetolactate synthase [Verrucomicrobiota bacterium]|nr:acetolactate synthase [Verrucomicrobiota bacterium]
MPAKSITSKRNEQKISQFAVFLENKVGRLLELVRLFRQYNVHIIALSIVDTTDSAICRMVVDDPERARTIFAEYTYAYSDCHLIAVELKNAESDLHNVLAALTQAECNVHFVYAFLVRPHDMSALALHVEDNDLATTVLTQAGFKLLTQRDITR